MVRRIISTIFAGFRDEEDDLSAAPWRRLIRISLPLIFNQGSVLVMMFVDRIFLSWYGLNEIAAVTPAAILCWTTITFFYSISSFIGLFVAHYHGAGNKRMCASTVWQGIYYTLAAYVVLMICLAPLGRQAFEWFGHHPEIAALEKTYYSVLICASLFTILNNVTASFFTGRGMSRITMTANIIGNIVNIVLAWLLIFGHFGLPRLGILGAATATAIASVVPPAIMFTLFLGKRYQEGYETRRAWALKPKFILRLVRTGAPCGLQDLAFLLSISLFFMLMGRAPTEALAANNIAWSINDLMTLYFQGLAAGSVMLFAQEIGRGRFREAESFIYLGFKILLGLALVVGGIYLLFPEHVLTLFRPRLGNGPSVPFESVLEHGRVVLRYLAVWNICLAFYFLFRQALRGAGDTRFFYFTAVIIDAGVFMGGVFVILHLFGTNVGALWNYLLFYMALACVIYVARFRLGYWRTADRAHLDEEHLW
jgi:multidrug resistance protein, MATE family